MIMISPTSDITPDQLVRFVHGLGLGLGVKETCYGINIQGPVEERLSRISEILTLTGFFQKSVLFPSEMSADAGPTTAQDLVIRSLKKSGATSPKWTVP